MKILHVIEIRGIGGAEKILLGLLSAQARTNNKIYCLILSMNNEKEANWIGDCLTQNRVEVRHLTFTSKFFSRSLLKKIQASVNEYKPDIIHAHLKLAEYYLSVSKYLRLNKAPLVSTIHGIQDKYQNQYSRNAVAKQLTSTRLFLTRLLLANYDGLVFVSEFMMNFHLHKKLVTQKKVLAVIYNGVSVSDTQQALLQTDKSGNYKLILPGRLIELKGHAYAIEAIKILAGKYPQIELDIFGTGADEDIIRKKIADAGQSARISLKGFTNHLSGILPSYRLALLPSLFESFGMVFLEAFQAGVPVVSFNVPAGNEIVRNQYSGLLASPRNTQELAECIDHLLSDEALYDNIRSNALSELKEKFDIDQIAAQYIVFYEKILLNNKMY